MNRYLISFVIREIYLPLFGLKMECKPVGKMVLISTDILVTCSAPDSEVATKGIVVCRFMFDLQIEGKD